MDFEPFNFETLGAKQIKDYMDEHATTKQKKDFKKEVFVSQKKKKGEVVKDKDGNPIMFQVKDKDGNLKFNSKGQPMMRKKLEYVEIEDSEEELVFSLLKAKWWFSDNFPEAVKNVPKRRVVKSKAGDLFKDW